MSLLKEMVGNGRVVRFEKYHAGNLWYSLRYAHRNAEGRPEGHTFAFPVPISDIGDATFLAEDKAILFMRYIRKALESEE